MNTFDKQQGGSKSNVDGGITDTLMLRCISKDCELHTT